MLIGVMMKMPGKYLVNVSKYTRYLIQALLVVMLVDLYLRQTQIHANIFIFI